ncbi:MAG: AAA family ATPase, partial [Candidatus Acidulodesulfobacterium sp.]
MQKKPIFDNVADNTAENTSNDNGINEKEISEAISNFLNPAEIVETHISRVYLTDKFAYKQKKIVNFGFVDYTSLEKRIYFAKKELSLNRRACSGIYIDLLELRKKNGRYFIGFKGGKLIDVLVRMKRVDPAFFLNNLISGHTESSFININININKDKNKDIGTDRYIGTGKKNKDKNINIDTDADDILKKTAKKIYLFHKNARKSKRISKFGSYDVYRANWDDNFQTVKEYLAADAFFTQKFLNSFFAFIDSLLSSRLFSEFIRFRSDRGFVRDVHGDLRMEHIAVLDVSRVNGVCLMDCVEFDERYRCQDIYLDIAFLLMDFEFNGYFYESVKFFGYYKKCFNYLKFIAPFERYEHIVIPLFKAYRAIVRCKISLLSKNSGEDSRFKAIKYFKLAVFYLAAAKKPVVILNCGLPGSGKSSLSRLLSAWFYARIFSTDEIRQALYGSAEKSVKYSAEANSKVYKTMLDEGLKEFEKCKSVMDNAVNDDAENIANNSAWTGEIESGVRGVLGAAAGGGVIFDATFLKRSHREKIINAFNAKDCIFISVYSKIYDEKEEVILKRLEDRFRNTMKVNGLKDYSEADASVYFNQKAYFEEPSGSELESLFVVSAKAKTEDDNDNSFYSYNIKPFFIQIDAADELKDRFNAFMKGLQ